MIVGSYSWKAIAYGNGKYIAVSSGTYSFDAYSYISTSTDGINWTTPIRVDNVRMTGMTYANGKFVATGDEVSGGVFNMAVSTDGVNWTLKKIADKTLDVVYGNGKFVAVGYQRAYTSTDGINWKYYHFNTEPNRVPNDLNGIIYGNGKFVGVGIWGRAISSTDGENWTVVQVGDYGWNSVAYGNGKYVAVGIRTSGFDNYGIFMTSTDGVNWETKTVGSNIYYRIIYSNGKFIAVGSNGYITTSVDSITWTTPEQTKDESGKVVTANFNGVCAMP